MATGELSDERWTVKPEGGMAETAGTPQSAGEHEPSPGVQRDGEPRPVPPGGTRGRRRAAGIYGAIVTAAILVAAGGHVSTAALTVAVLVTLVVYWVAEEYAELLGEHVEHGRLPTRQQIRAELAATWPMVSASYLPLLAMVLTRLAGASLSGATLAGLVTAVVLLVYHAWSAGSAAQLEGRQLLAATSVAAVLGVMMIVLKELVLVHLH